MAMIVEGETKCPLCNRVFEKGQDVVGFPAFLPAAHELCQFSDATFHRACFEANPLARTVSDLYARYRRAWSERPRQLKTLDAIEAWHRTMLIRLSPKRVVR